MSLEGSRKEGKKYINVIPTDEGGFGKILPILGEYINNKAENTPLKTLGPFKTDTTAYQNPPASGLRITWIGHTSILIEIDGKRILTDPVWGERVSFSKYIGPKRFFQPPLSLSELPPLDAIIISHDHYDHLDKDTIQFFAGSSSTPFYCSVGVGQHLSKWGISQNRISEMDWGNSVVIGNDLVVTATPSRHFSGRGITGRNETLWSSFVIRGPKHNIYFGADSGWSPSFAEIGEAFGPFDLTILEIGAYGKYWPDIHMGPDHASNAHLALKGKLMMPVHYGTFSLAPHAWYEPIERLTDLAKDKNINLFVPKPGEPTEVKEAYNSNWWKPYLS
ncbi:MBL fold metallo-hydrolase [Mucilaginibacter lappiensis]|uniref:L-ascorbate metabolism protein UlaG (Beta-lactamase superfamily) n=1 Tax=Mucilaginibacter lappiensis TaxID=354630 RepID=A0A1N7C665_9SPHI|nr:MBL fold metallo-hydrolase [Mucilaginibacter lappiensis]MBB6110975.1 L-ascorbate metabolism protein UlaG (beta-lactamase superfamily) [Mucilaginibacter lappiensis]MBB6127982.1 L-ascorbate metabolism protein UlaG (beta-lactamase superfamily) [Mucilaginibacter lappiensis]SIR59141.1 L-ascorbate metabolism protein UlaG, beta-lactamase superfamily [Mucilaginibacter lappiensis]